MKNIVAICIAMLTYAGTYAQQNDTTLLRKLKVSEIVKYQRVHALLGNNDTCLLEHKKLNKYGLDTFSYLNLGCSGYKQKDITRSAYKGRNMVTQTFERNKVILADYAFDYHRKTNLIAKKTSLDIASGDESVTSYIYFKKKRAKLIDSIRITIQNGEETQAYITRNKYDKKKRLISTVSEDSKGIKLQETIHSRGDNGKIESTTFATYGEKTTFVQTFFKYDQEGRVVETNDTHNRQNIYLYTDEGLLSNMMGYNAKGQLEVEFIYKYTFGK